ncbi:hypothetical protein K466DRAFT_58098 [Polyporus arcularius HHB13444]|uniref:MYND-type domain-containing protein n=1 Tax=Polyporus arcularius HHB13444 TaxID=1314778 RepID=A0A5C3PRI9_9APHY|nr:hypothetical protein K466DRAFT_58098 [Polyporus arcularius HHB13444]
MSEPDSTNTPAILRLCAYCECEPAEGPKFRRCAGCFAGPIYCSRECQKAHWPVHRLASHGLRKDVAFYKDAVEPCARAIGFRSASALSKALSDFLEAHNWAIKTAAMALRVATYGYSHDTMGECDYKEVIRVHLAYNGPGRNPARTFRWRSIEWTDIAQWLSDMQLSYMEDDITSMYGEARKMAYREFGHDEHYVSSFPIVITLQDVPITLWQMNPQYSPRRYIPPTLGFNTSWVEDERRDLKRFCMSCVNNGVSLRYPGEVPGNGVALPGRFIRSQHRWVWVPYINNWSETRTGAIPHRPLARVLGVTYTGSWNPEEMMRAFNNYRTGPTGMLGVAMDNGPGRPMTLI